VTNCAGWSLADDFLVIETGSDSAPASTDHIFYSVVLAHLKKKKKPLSQGNDVCFLNKTVSCIICKMEINALRF
jgi:hypothetical protein